MIALMTFALAALAQDEPVDVTELLRRLSAADTAARDDAQRRLEALGAPVAPLLREALSRTEDPDTRARLEHLLRKAARPARSKQDAKKQVEEMSRALARMQKVLSDKGLPDEEKAAQVLMMTAQIHAVALGGAVIKIEGSEAMSEPARQVVDRFLALDRAEKDRVVRELLRRHLEAGRAEVDPGLDEVRKLIERMLREAEPPAPPPPEKKKD